MKVIMNLVNMNR